MSPFMGQLFGGLLQFGLTSSKGSLQYCRSLETEVIQISASTVRLTPHWVMPVSVIIEEKANPAPLPEISVYIRMQYNHY